MGIIEAIFNKVDVLAVIAFMAATLFVTMGLKGLLRRVIWFCAAMENEFFKLCLSWLAGAAIYAFAFPYLFPSIVANDLSKLQFIWWTLVLNGGYKLVTWLLKTWKEMRGI